MSMLQNKWTEGGARFDLTQVDQRILRAEGILPISVCLSEAVGSEIVLLYLDHTSFIYDLARMCPFNMYLKSGLARTSFGPILFHLFRFCRDNPQEPVLLVDAYINPFNPHQITTWRDLSRQSHWHVFLIDSKGEHVGFFEFANTFNLGHTLDIMGQVCRVMKEGDFIAAKEEFCTKYTVNDLDAMK